MGKTKLKSCCALDSGGGRGGVLLLVFGRNEQSVLALNGFLASRYPDAVVENSPKTFEEKEAKAVSAER